MQSDLCGEWVLLLFPLLDPDATFAPAPAHPSAPELKGVQFYHPKLTPCLVYFHPDTKLLTRVVYEGREFGSAGMKELQALEYATFAGVKLPSRLAQNFAGKQPGGLAGDEAGAEGERGRGAVPGEVTHARPHPPALGTTSRRALPRRPG